MEKLIEITANQSYKIDGNLIRIYENGIEIKSEEFYELVDNENGDLIIKI